MNIEENISKAVVGAVKSLYGIEVAENGIQLQKTKSDFEGDITLVVFTFTKTARKQPEVIGNEIGQWLTENTDIVDKYNVIKGFLNLSISKDNWISTLNNIYNDKKYGTKEETPESPLMMIEYSSPNTNKPLHLGHVRNNLLGYSISQIQKANGWKVVKTNIVNDRGIHICKSMLAWLKYGNGETPASTGMKGDHLIGKYYVEFDKHYKAELKELQAKGMSEDEAKANSSLMKEAQAMLLKWEQNDPEIRSLWQMMNEWVYAGFDETYKRLGVDFDKIYYESNTYLEGKEKVVNEILQVAKDSTSFILFDYRGLTAEESSELRKILRDNDSNYKIWKNTLAKRALDSLNYNLDDCLAGPSAIAYSSDAIAPIKALSTFAKDHPALEIKGGIVDGNVTSLDEIKALSTIPSREGLLTMLAGGLIGTVKDLSIALNLLSEQKSE